MKENNRTKERQPRYIIVYNKILKLIQDGVYPEGAKLPTEPQLAELMEVSRMTLRQAFTMLQEDGIIESRQGIGTFIRKTLNHDSVGLEKIGNPIYKTCSEEIKSITCESKVDVAVDYTNTVLRRKVPFLLSSNLNYYNHESKICATCFSIVPSDYTILNDIDLNVIEEVKQLLIKDIYTEAHNVSYEVKIVPENHVLVEKGITSIHNTFMMILETIKDVHGEVICYNKYHIPSEYANLYIHSYQ